MFKNGPIAWNGAFSFYVAMVAVLTWFLVNSYVVLKATKRQEHDAPPGVTSTPHTANPTVESLAADLAELREQLARDRQLSQ